MPPNVRDQLRVAYQEIRDLKNKLANLEFPAAQALAEARSERDKAAALAARLVRENDAYRAHAMALVELAVATLASGKTLK